MGLMDTLNPDNIELYIAVPIFIFLMLVLAVIHLRELKLARDGERRMKQAVQNAYDHNRKFKKR